MKNIYTSLLVLLGVSLALFFAGCTNNPLLPGSNSSNASLCNVNTDSLDTTYLTYFAPPGCPSYICNIGDLTSWSTKLSIPVREYSADWASGPIALLYKNESVYLLTLTNEQLFMKDMCNELNDAKACSIYAQLSAESLKEARACLVNNSLGVDTILFLYSNTCPHCANMKPYVLELQNASYNFLWAEVQDQKNLSIAASCYGGIIDSSAGVPQFACVANGKWQLGAFASKNAMKSFADECKEAASKPLPATTPPVGESGSADEWQPSPLIDEYGAKSTPLLVMNCLYSRTGSYSIAEANGDIAPGTEKQDLINEFCAITGSSTFCSKNTSSSESISLKTLTTESCAADGKVKVYAFYSPTCPFCENQRPILDELKDEFGSNLEVSYICTKIHSGDEALCAQKIKDGEFSE
ncbi:MAG: thioredoxin family protein [Candidatus Micrarchaeota archaeon]